MCYNRVRTIGHRSKTYSCRTVRRHDMVQITLRHTRTNHYLEQKLERLAEKTQSSCPDSLFCDGSPFCRSLSSEVAVEARLLSRSRWATTQSHSNHAVVDKAVLVCMVFAPNVARRVQMILNNNSTIQELANVYVASYSINWTHLCLIRMMGLALAVILQTFRIHPQLTETG